MKLRLVQSVRWAKVEAGEDGGPPCGATEEDLALINSMPEVIVPRTHKNVFVRRAFGIHDGPLHGNRLQLATDSVRWLADHARGVKLMANHDTFTRGALPYGFIFRGGLVREADGLNWGAFDVALPRSPGNEEILLRMDGGAISEFSVQLAFESLKCNVCGKDPNRCPHEPGKNDCRAVVTDPNEFIELSLVMAGKAPGTRMAIAASRGGDFASVDALLEKQAPGMARYFSKDDVRGEEGPGMQHLFAQA